MYEEVRPPAQEEIMTMQAIHPDTHIGTVTLTVADLARSLQFYQETIGLRIQQQNEDSALLGANHKPLLHLQEVPNARPARRTTGLYHFALLVPSRLELARVINHFIETRFAIDGASDHLVSEALYLHDPDEHGIEIYRDRPRAEWVDANGNFRLDTLPLDIRAIMNELSNAPNLPWQGIHPDTVMGHIHLRAAELERTGRFYREVLGFDLMAALPSALFLSAGGYHHHIGMNTWSGVGVPAPTADMATLQSYEIVLPDAESLASVVRRIQNAGIEIAQQDTGWLVRDPSHNSILLRTAGS